MSQSDTTLKLELGEKLSVYHVLHVNGSVGVTLAVLAPDNSAVRSTTRLQFPKGSAAKHLRALADTALAAEAAVVAANAKKADAFLDRIGVA